MKFSISNTLPCNFLILQWTTHVHTRVHWSNCGMIPICECIIREREQDCWPNWTAWLFLTRWKKEKQKTIHRLQKNIWLHHKLALVLFFVSNKTIKLKNCDLWEGNAGVSWRLWNRGKSKWLCTILAHFPTYVIGSSGKGVSLQWCHYVASCFLSFDVRD